LSATWRAEVSESAGKHKLLTYVCASPNAYSKLPFLASVLPFLASVVITDALKRYGLVAIGGGDLREWAAVAWLARSRRLAAPSRKPCIEIATPKAAIWQLG
jgi:hypothetical protein